MDGGRELKIYILSKKSAGFQPPFLTIHLLFYHTEG